MQLYLATLETSNNYLFPLLKEESIEFGLISYYYLKDDEMLEIILNKCKKLLIDSGAHSFQHGKKVDFDDYTNKYIEFVKRWTNHPKIEGFFEMDVDNVLGVEKVEEYRKKLEAVSEKIIPVWHSFRGIDKFYEMCKEYSGKKISITGFRNGDMFDDQFNLFINTAHSFNCKVHILGLTRFNLIQNLNLGKEDSFDSSSWRQAGIFAGISFITKDKDIKKKDFLAGLNVHYTSFFKQNLYVWMKAQHLYKDLDNSIYLKK